MWKPPWLLESIQYGRSMKEILYLLAFGLLVPSAALAQVDAEVAAQRSEETPGISMAASGPSPLRSGVPMTLPLLTM